MTNDQKKMLTEYSSNLSLSSLLASSTLGRAIAIVLVVMAHLKVTVPQWQFLDVLASGGKLGVSLFVLYSGLLHQYQYRKKGDYISISPWLIKRAVRIYPSFWIGLVLSLVVGYYFRGLNYSLSAIIVNTLGGQLFLGINIISAGYATPYWFISLIILCYLLFLFTRRIKHKWSLVIISMFLSISIICINKTIHNDLFLFCLAMPMFFWGMWLADLFYYGFIMPGNRFYHVVVAVVLFLCSAVVFKIRYFINIEADISVFLKTMGVIILPPTTVFVAFTIGYIHEFLKVGATKLLAVFSWIGLISYAVYCIHEPLLIIVDRFNNNGHPLVGIIAFSIILLLLSWVITSLSNHILTHFNYQVE